MREYKTMTLSQGLSFAVSAIVFLLQQDTLSAQSPISDVADTITIVDARPLAVALDAVAKRHGWSVGYEDPLYLDPKQLRDVTVSVRRDHGSLAEQKRHPDSKVLVPLGGRLKVPYGVILGDEPRPVLQSLVDMENERLGFAAFGVVETASKFRVVPTAQLRADGAIEYRGSMLDRFVLIPFATRTAYSLLCEVISGFNASYSEKLSLGSVPTNLLMQTHLTSGGQKTVAESLGDAFESIGLPMSWQMLYDPSSGTFALNVMTVRGKVSQ